MLALAAALIGVAVPAQGQTVAWVRQFGTAAHDAASAVRTDASGNIYVGGVTRGALPGNVYAAGFIGGVWLETKPSAMMNDKNFIAIAVSL